MLKAVIVVVLLSLFCRWAVGRLPWDFLVSPARPRAVQRARHLLGVEAGAGREEIIAAHRRLTARVHPDKGGSNSAMQEANAARDLLLDELPAQRDRTGA
ncbi:J domain-containing protein [Erythrobacter sp. WG]|uniref:J domain-containing protein n=1 Tax=Erythrobacter sp. WG TaxID=2985510 RepID=UPI00226D540A|nr:J domain-containing protein [Erythrobacter sp. WG]MCX9145924.1 J domain-containing protein [Erythrobacter sp. WG]